MLCGRVKRDFGLQQCIVFTFCCPRILRVSWKFRGGSCRVAFYAKQQKVLPREKWKREREKIASLRGISLPSIYRECAFNLSARGHLTSGSWWTFRANYFYYSIYRVSMCIYWGLRRPTLKATIYIHVWQMRLRLQIQFMQITTSALSYALQLCTRALAYFSPQT